MTRGTPTPVRVAIVEDDPAVAAFLGEQVATAPGLVVVGRAGSLTDARRLAAGRPDVWLVDLALPDGSGVDFITEARAAAPTAKFLVITVFGDVRRVLAAIEAGADGYLLKGAEDEHVAWAIRTVVEGGAPISPAVAAHILTKLRPTPGGSPERDESTLTAREREVLGGLARGLSYKEVATQHGISPHTVADHVKGIYRKLAVTSRGEAVYKAVQTGLIKLEE